MMTPVVPHTVPGVRFVLGVSKPDSLKPGCLQILSGDALGALLRSFAYLRFPEGPTIKKI